MKRKPKPKPARWLHLGISVNADLRQKLQAEARRQSRSVSSLVRLILSIWLSAEDYPTHTQQLPLSAIPTPSSPEP